MASTFTVVASVRPEFRVNPEFPLNELIFPPAFKANLRDDPPKFGQGPGWKAYRYGKKIPFMISPEG
jgi:hypothetical protein